MTGKKKHFPFSTMLPVVFFIGLVILFFISLTTSRDRQTIPSVLIGKNLPQILLQPLEGTGLPGVVTPDLIHPQNVKGRVTIINIWASWCGPCRQEHPFLMRLSERSDLRIVGINYKDQNRQALKFLKGLGNPYELIGVDPNGQGAIELGVYGVPETFIMSPSGKVVFKHVGPIISEQEQKSFLKNIAEAQKK